mmetsp:Transcript_91476/g.261278  ORF Transcript_91476/g.261278 Transcript_91476/m.261278 type:complete len:275 (-) Transcript_91476:696-1520(-)
MLSCFDCTRLIAFHTRALRCVALDPRASSARCQSLTKFPQLRHATASWRLCTRAQPRKRMATEVVCCFLSRAVSVISCTTVIHWRQLWASATLRNRWSARTISGRMRCRIPCCRSRHSATSSAHARQALLICRLCMRENPLNRRWTELVCWRISSSRTNLSRNTTTHCRNPAARLRFLRRCRTRPTTATRWAVASARCVLARARRWLRLECSMSMRNAMPSCRFKNTIRIRDMSDLWWCSERRLIRSWCTLWHHARQATCNDRCWMCMSVRLTI